MTGKATRVTMWPNAAAVLGALLDNYESKGHPCFDDNVCEYADDCDAQKALACKFSKQLTDLKQRLHKAAYP